MAARAPDWLIYPGLAALLVGAVVVTQVAGGHSPGLAPPRAPTTGGPAQASAPASPFEPTITVDAPSVSRPGAGTAFSISGGGIWLTARHVVEGCARTAIVVGPGQGVAAEVRIDPHGETAVLVTQGGAPALPLAPGGTPASGARAFHAGFPAGRPGQVATRFLGPEMLVMRGRHSRREAVLAWVEEDVNPTGSRDLAGLSGAPALDSRGRVIGVTIAQSRRRGRVYTTTPRALRAALARAHITPATGAEAAPMSAGSYSRISRDLRGDLRIVPVVCLSA